MFREPYPAGEGTANLTPLGDAGKAEHLTLVPPDANESSAHATVSVNNLGLVDLLQVAVSGLKPGKKYMLWLVESRTAPFGRKEGLVTFQANLAGAQVAQTVGLLRQVLTSANETPTQQRFLMITQAESDMPALIQQRQKIKDLLSPDQTRCHPPRLSSK